MWLSGGPAPYREALVRRLDNAGLELIDAPDDTCAVVSYVGDDSGWDVVAAFVELQPVIAVLPDPMIELYVRALASGAGAVQIDTPTEAMIDVILAAIRGESLLPLSVTQALSQHMPPTSADIVGEPLTPLEERVAQALVAGTTIAAIAKELNYSDRTLRRKLQGLYLKLGVVDRYGAITALKSR